MVGKGLRVYPGGDGSASGAHFDTRVGKIDLLARDAAAGWVIVLVDSVPEDLGYTAAAVSDTVELKLYRVGLTLEKVDV